MPRKKKPSPPKPSLKLRAMAARGGSPQRITSNLTWMSSSQAKKEGEKRLFTSWALEEKRIGEKHAKAAQAINKKVASTPRGQVQQKRRMNLGGGTSVGSGFYAGEGYRSAMAGAAKKKAKRKVFKRKSR